MGAKPTRLRGDDEAIEASRMSFGDHLDELRRRVFYALLGVVAAVVVAVFFAAEIITLLSQPLVLALAMEGLNPRLYQEQVPQLFLNYLQVSILAGLILASPWVAYQLWKFVATGLFERERKAVRVYGPASVFLFLLGAAFVYLIVLPFGLRFFVQFNRGFEPPSPTFRTPIQKLIYSDEELPEPAPQTQPAGPVRLPELDRPPPYEPGMDGVAWIDRTTGQLQFYHNGRVKAVPPTSESLVQPWYNLADYLKFATTLMFVFGLGFQTPLVILFLARTGLVPTRRMARSRRVIVLIIFVLAAVLTPPDVISQVLLAIPMLGLFELGLLLGRRAERKRERLEGPTEA